jgi:hypothetical protein
MVESFVITESDVDRELDSLLSDPIQTRRFNFVITETDIDRELDLVVEAKDPIDQWNKVMTLFKGTSGGEKEAAFNALKRLQVRHPEELGANVTLPAPPEGYEDPEAGATGEATPAEKKRQEEPAVGVRPQQRWQDRDPRFDKKTGAPPPSGKIPLRIAGPIGDAEVDPKKQITGGHHEISIAGQTYDREKLKQIAGDIQKQIAAQPTGTQAQDQQFLATIQGKIKSSEEIGDVKADIETTDVSLSGVDSARMVGGWRSVGDAKMTQLRDQFGATEAGLMAVSMYGHLIDASSNQAIQFRVSDGSFGASEANIIMTNWRNVMEKEVKRIHDLSTKTKEDEGEMLKITDQLSKSNEKLEDLKTQLEEDPVRTKAFNALKKELWGDMVAEYSKAYEKIKGPEEEEPTLEEKQEGVDKMRKLNEDKLAEIVIDFNEIRSNQLDESWLAMFGGWVEYLMKRIFSGSSIPVQIQGTSGEVKSFANALGREKNYINVAKRYGLDHPSTYRSKAKLDNATKNFERETGIKWPFK